MKSQTGEHDPLNESDVRNHTQNKEAIDTLRVTSSSTSLPPQTLENNFSDPKTFFLFFAGLLFVSVGFEQTIEKGIGETYPYFILGTLLLIPGIYFGVMIICIWIGVEGFNYEMLPKTDN